MSVQQHVLETLENGPASTGALLKGLPAKTPNANTRMFKTLRTLERQGVIRETGHPKVWELTVPPGVLTNVHLDASRIYSGICDLLALPEMYSAQAVALAVDTLKRRLLDVPGAVIGAQVDLTQSVLKFLTAFSHDEAAAEASSAASELEKLRVSVARIAQQLKLDQIPGCTLEANFTELTNAARNKQRGWNALGAAISSKVDTLLDQEMTQIGMLQRQVHTLKSVIQEMEREAEDLRRWLSEALDTEQ